MGGRRWKGEERSDQPAGRGKSGSTPKGRGPEKTPQLETVKVKEGERVAWRVVKQRKKAKEREDGRESNTAKRARKRNWFDFSLINKNFGLEQCENGKDG